MLSVRGESDEGLQGGVVLGNVPGPEGRNALTNNLPNPPSANK